jgi:hypothetical protein
VIAESTEPGRIVVHVTNDDQPISLSAESTDEILEELENVGVIVAGEQKIP